MLFIGIVRAHRFFVSKYFIQKVTATSVSVLPRHFSILAFNLFFFSFLRNLQYDDNLQTLHNCKLCSALNEFWVKLDAIDKQNSDLELQLSQHALHRAPTFPPNI